MTQPATTRENIGTRFGPFPIVGLTIGGEPILDPKWVKNTIVKVDFCGHVVWVHRGIADVVFEAGYWIKSEGLAGEVRRADSFCVRWIRGHDGELSMHAKGLALDINPVENPLGSTTCKIHPRVVEIMKLKGFVHGADWVHRPDPMHFEIRGE